MADRFVIQASMRLVVLLSLMHFSALWSIWSTSLTGWGRLGLALPILLSLFHLFNRYLFAGKQSWIAFVLDDRRVSVVVRNGAELAGEVLHQTVVTPYFVLLRVKFDGHRLPTSQIIFPDALQDDAYRRLCVHLKFA